MSDNQKGIGSHNRVFDVVVDYCRKRLIAEYGADARKHPTSACYLANVACNVRRHAEKRKGICFASLEKMAEEIGVSRYIVKRCLLLSESFDLIDCIERSKGGRKKTSVYIPTDKLRELIGPKISGYWDRPLDDKPAVRPRLMEPKLALHSRVSNLGPRSVLINSRSDWDEEIFKRQESPREESFMRQSVLPKSSDDQMRQLADEQKFLSERDLQDRVARDKRKGNFRPLLGNGERASTVSQ